MVATWGIIWVFLSIYLIDLLIPVFWPSILKFFLASQYLPQSPFHFVYPLRIILNGLQLSSPLMLHCFICLLPIAMSLWLHDGRISQTLARPSLWSRSAITWSDQKPYGCPGVQTMVHWVLKQLCTKVLVWFFPVFPGASSPFPLDLMLPEINWKAVSLHGQSGLEYNSA